MDENTNATVSNATSEAPATKAEPTAKVEEKPTTPLTNAEEEARIQSLLVENAKLKRAMERANSEAADFKKKYNATLSEQERASQEILPSISQKVVPTFLLLLPKERFMGRFPWKQSR